MRKIIFRENVKTIVVRMFCQAIAIPCITVGLISCNSMGDRAKTSTNYKLAGTWEFKNQDGVKTGIAIFENQNEVDGNVYILSNNSPSGDLSLGKTAIAGKFKVNSSTNPQQLDLVFGDLTTQTIYEIDNDGKLKIANAVPEQPRPTVLDTQPQQLTKVSDSTTVAKDVKILRSPDLVSSSLLIREAEGKSYIRVIMRSQQQIFQEQGQFSQDINQLKSGLSLNSEFYSYKITILGDLVQNNAIPLKDGLKAYTGIVYAIASDDANQKVTKLLLCESNIPTKQIPTKPQNQDEGYKCPSAYTSINP
ncbi:type IV pilin-like G/H family protein [Pseudanabaena sp. BC1403]|uniref:type IV pilin-like G/H family protein n=1 Tax=Pseudanabaena sp. BC1403 TaxID=2043171 RepID=UPI000CD93CA7|nr:type IV pilin-like G/H family protein [Pseudanabaena sp. BC1403]